VHGYQCKKTNKNYMYEENEKRLHSWKACCHSVQDLLSLHLLSKNIKN
jgi:hypothetical protein